MTTNELIAKLEKISEKYGDMEIVVPDPIWSGITHEPFISVYDGKVIIELR